MPSSSPSPPNLRHRSSYLSRLQHITFAWFTSSMSLGGISNLLLSRIINSNPLYYLGISLFLLNNIYLLLLIIIQILRYTLTPATFSYTLSHPIECCFIPTALLAVATVINGFAYVVRGEAGSGWEVVLRGVFWVYFVASLLVGLVCYTSLFGRAEQSLHHMNPGWVLPIFPLTLCGSIAAAVVPTQGEVAALAISICGLTCQGLGFAVSCMMYSVLLLRLMTEGFPPPRARPGLFMCCGPPAFTIICLLGLSSEMQRILPALPQPPPLPPSTYETLSVIALATSILLWTISAWFYLLTLCSLFKVLASSEERREMEFICVWWACVFPITGFATATYQIGVALRSRAVKGLAEGMVVWLMAVFVGVGVMHGRAVWKGGIAREGKDEDRVIDTIVNRFHNSDLEKASPSTPGSKSQEEKGEQENQEKDPCSNPPTYPSTPAVSVLRLDLKHHQQQHHEQDDDADAIHPLPTPSLSSSPSPSSSSSTRALEELRITPLTSCRST